MGCRDGQGGGRGEVEGGESTEGGMALLIKKKCHPFVGIGSLRRHPCHPTLSAYSLHRLYPYPVLRTGVIICRSIHA